MNPIIEKKSLELKNVFEKHKVKEAYIFGSCVSPNSLNFNEKSDIDFLVEFDKNLEELEYGKQWFSLLENLENLLNRKIDLLTIESLKNPYFIQELNKTKVKIYGK